MGRWSGLVGRPEGMRASSLLAGVTVALSAALGVAACGGWGSQPMTPSAGGVGVTFEDDVAFLRRHGEVTVLTTKEGGVVAVSPRYQGRVMTSGVGPRDRSLGWINRGFIEAGKTGTAFDNYGGEDRFWLGPEGGQYALYFPPGKPFAFDQWQTPAAFQEGAWAVKSQDGTSVVMTRSIQVTNYAGTRFTMDVERTVRVLSAEDAQRRFGVAVPNAVRTVAFETENRITNKGAAAWTEEAGLVSVWILGMFAPAEDAHVLIPFQPGPGPVVNDAYFGKVPAERLRVDEAAGHLSFTCDGKLRSKIGLGPARAKNVAGSYSASARLLTVVHYDKPEGAKRYVNSMWETQKEPYGGDVINSYNDGPTAPGKPSLGGFYEIETSSPAAALAPGASLVHVHRTFHFEGEKPALDGIARAALGVGL